jgi:hypothetical protein
VDKYLEESKTRRDAIFYCALQGYDAGNEIAQSDTKSENLASALGLGQAASACDKKLREVETEEVRLRPRVTPLLTVEAAEAEAHAPGWSAAADELIRITRNGLVVLHK